MSVIAALTVAHIYSLVRLAEHDYVMDRVVWVLNFDQELNIPSAFSFALLICCSALLACIAYSSSLKKLNFTLHWWILSAIFCFLAFDEAFSIHEAIGDLIESRQSTSGALKYVWVVPYGVLALLVLSTYVKFLIHLPVIHRVLFIVAGGLYVGGALGMELLEGAIVDTCPDYCLPLLVMVTLEELMEMTGAALFIYALLHFIAIRDEQLHIPGVRHLVTIQR